MTESRLALLAGLFLVPALLLWMGHRLRRRTGGWRAAFWGATAGYGLGMLAALAALHQPPVLWTGGGRAAVVHWGMLAGAALGCAIGWLAGRRRMDAQARTSGHGASVRSLPGE
jgi:hypothetical protein